MAVARQMLSRKISVTEAARQLTRIGHSLGVALEGPFLTFVGIDSETDTCPLGPVRAWWGAAALAREDAERERYEDIVRGSAEEACWNLIRQFAPDV